MLEMVVHKTKVVKTHPLEIFRLPMVEGFQDQVVVLVVVEDVEVRLEIRLKPKEIEEVLLVFV